MLSKYIQAAMERAQYEILPEEGTYFGRIPGFDGVWANAATLEACRQELAEVLEGWLLIGISQHLPIPVIDEIDLTVPRGRSHDPHPTVVWRGPHRGSPAS